jgi:nitrate reductase NapAB chaperone NapD
MEKRDLILDQIEQMGFFLRKLLADFVTNKLRNNEINTSDLVTNELKNELDFDLKLFLSLANEEIKKNILTFKFTEEHLESFSKLLVKMSALETNEKLETIEYLSKALKVLDIADDISSTFSFERNSKKNQIKELLKNN